MWILSDHWYTKRVAVFGKMKEKGIRILSRDNDNRLFSKKKGICEKMARILYLVGLK